MSRKIPISDDDILMWLRRIDDARKRRDTDHLPYWQRVFQSYSAIRPENAIDVNPDVVGENIHFNFILSTANTILPSVINAHPAIRVRPRRGEDRDSASKTQNAVNYAWRESDTTKTVKKIVLDTLLFGVGIGKTVYDSGGAALTPEDFDDGPEKIDEDPDRLTPEQQRELQKAVGDGVLLDAGDPQDNPRLLRVPIERFLVPQGYTEINQMPWICEEIPYPLDDIKRDPLYRVDSSIEANYELKSRLHVETQMERYRSGDDSRQKHILVYEIRYWEKTKRGMERRLLYLTTASTDTVQHKVLRHVVDPLEMKGYPYDTLKFVDVPGEFYSTQVADLAAIEPIAERLNDSLAYSMRHQRLNSRRKYIISADLDEEGAVDQLFSSDEDMAYAAIPGLVDARAAVALLPEAPPSSDTPFVQRMLQQMMYEISGVTTYQRGGVGRKGTTATEAAIAADASAGRAGIRRTETEAFVASVGRRYISVMRQFWDQPRFIRIAGQGPNGEDGFEQFSSEDIKGFYDIEVAAGTLQPIDPAAEQNAFIGLLQTINQMLPTLQGLAQLGLADEKVIANFLDRAMQVWNQDKRELIGPLAQLNSLLGSGFGGGGGEVAPDEIDGRGMDPSGGALAGPNNTPGNLT